MELIDFVNTVIFDDLSIAYWASQDEPTASQLLAIEAAQLMGVLPE